MKGYIKKQQKWFNLKVHANFYYLIYINLKNLTSLGYKREKNTFSPANPGLAGKSLFSRLHPSVYDWQPG